MDTSERLSLLRSLRGRRVFVAGAGRQGIAATQLALSLRARVVLGDDADETRIHHSLNDAGIETGGLTVQAGGIRPEALEDAELIVLSAGLPRTHPAIQFAISRNIPICNEVELGAAQLDEPTIVGITGTNGKSTTTTMMGDILRLHEPNLFVGGNLGTPLCEVVAQGKRPRWLVLELSSYQLETIETLPLKVGVVTNLAPDHLDRYPSVEAYYRAKQRIFSLLVSTGVGVTNRSDPMSNTIFGEGDQFTRFDFGVSHGQPGVFIEEETLSVVRDNAARQIHLENPRIVGPHNRQNAAAALAAASALEVAHSTMAEGLRAYGGIPHRLERLGTAKEIEWFNDSKATNVDAARTALESFSARVHLIVGGVGKGASYEPLVEASSERVVRVYTIGQDAPVLLQAFSGRIPATDAQTLEVAVATALKHATPGDILLLAPACASFDQFPNYQVRGDTFRALFEAAREKP